MTSEEIKGRLERIDAAGPECAVTAVGVLANVLGFWLAEIAYQLAKRNEGPMGARMEKLLRAYAADDPCAPHDPRTKEAVEILAAIDQHQRNEAKA